MKTALHAFLLSLFGLFCTAEAAHAVPTTDEIAAGWEKFRAQLYGVTSYRVTVDNTNPQTGNRTSITFNVVRNGTTDIILEFSTLEYVACANSKYSFSIRREPEATAYVVERYSIGEPLADESCAFFSVINSPAILHLVYPESTAYNTSLFQKLPKHQLELQTVTEDIECYIFKCRYSHQDTKDASANYDEILCKLDKSDFRILSMEINHYRGGNKVSTSTVVIDYGEYKGFPVVKSVNYKTSMMEGTLVFDEFDTQVPDQSRFTLSHYGLPEPEGIVWEKPTPRYVWFLSIAAGAALLMFLVGWLLKRRAKTRVAA